MSLREFSGHAPEIGEDVWIDPSAIVIGDVHIGAGSSIWPQVVLRGDIHRIRIGPRTNVQDGSVGHVTHDSPFHPGGAALEVGAGVTIGHRVILHGCTVGDGCLVGMGSIVMDGAVLEPGVLLGAGSLVPGGRRLEGGTLWMGTPARRVRSLSDREREFLAYSAEHYTALGRRCLEEAARPG